MKLEAPSLKVRMTSRLRWTAGSRLSLVPPPLRRSVKHRERMWQTYIFRTHWKHGGKMYYDELTAGSKEEAPAMTSAWFASSWLAQKSRALASIRIHRFHPSARCGHVGAWIPV